MIELKGREENESSRTANFVRIYKYAMLMNILQLVYIVQTNLFVYS